MWCGIVLENQICISEQILLWFTINSPHVDQSYLNIEWDVFVDMNNAIASTMLILQLWLTHWGRDKMAAMSQTTLSNAFCLNENVEILIKVSLKLVNKGPIKNIPALVQIMAWRRPGDKPLSEPMMVRLPTHICVTRPQWVKGLIRVGRELLQQHRSDLLFGAGTSQERSSQMYLPQNTFKISTKSGEVAQLPPLWRHAFLLID